MKAFKVLSDGRLQRSAVPRKVLDGNKGKPINSVKNLQHHLTKQLRKKLADEGASQ